MSDNHDVLHWSFLVYRRSPFGRNQAVDSGCPPLDRDQRGIAAVYPSINFLRRGGSILNCPALFDRTSEYGCPHADFEAKGVVTDWNEGVYAADEVMVKMQPEDSEK